MSRFATFGMIALLSVAEVKAAEPVQAHCPVWDRKLDVRIVGANSDLVEIWEKDRLLFGDYNQMRQSMGPQPQHHLICPDVTCGSDVIAVRAGWKKDIVHAYGLIKNSQGETVGVQRAIARLRDGDYISISCDGNDVLITFGRKSDLRTRLCFGNRPGADNPPYSPTEWGWFYGTPRTGNFPACQGRLNTGANGSANWSQDHFSAGATD